MQNINRRNILKSVAAAAAGVMISGTRTASAEKSNEKKTENKITAKQFVETADGTRLFYKDWGSGQTVLFIHSWAANSDLWQYAMNDLCDAGLRCAAYDRRGHGRSDQPWSGFGIDTLAGDLNAVIEKLKLDKITLVSHSMASGEVVRYLTKYGAKRVSKIVLASPTTPFSLKTADNPDGADKQFFEQFRNALKRDVPGTLKAGAAGFFGENPPVSTDLMNWAIRMCEKTSLRAMLECNRVNTETDFRSEMKKISVPALIIHGGADVSAPLETTAKRSARLLPNVKLKVYKDAPHGIVLTHKDEFSRDLLDFIKR